MLIDLQSQHSLLIIIYFFFFCFVFQSHPIPSEFCCVPNRNRNHPIYECVPLRRRPTHDTNLD